MKTAIIILGGASEESIRQVKDTLKNFCWVWNCSGDRLDVVESAVASFGQFSDMDSIKRKGKEFEVALLLIKTHKNKREIQDLFGASEIYGGCSDDRYTHDYVVDVSSTSLDEELKSVINILTK